MDANTGELHDGTGSRLLTWELQAAARKLLPDHRVGQCLRRKIPDRKIGVRRREDASTYYQGLRVCGSVWVCARCAAKVSERRRKELAAAVDVHTERGGQVYLLTLTVPHKATAAAFGLVDRLLDAYRKLNSGRSALAGLVSGYAGQVRALEVTLGRNGWHPHLHVLLFAARGLDVQVLRDEISARWAHQVRKLGLGEIHQAHGATLQDGSAAAEYAGKWGVVEEVTKANVKRARSLHGRTPFALLADYSAGDTLAGQFFREFVAAFKGRAQLHWSTGLRDLVGLSHEQSDEEVAAAVDAEDELVASITDREWSFIVRNNLRGLVLEVLRGQGTLDDLARLLESYRASDPGVT